MKSIRSLEHLLEELNKCEDQSDYVALVKDLQIDPSEFDEYAHWSTEKYTRNCIKRTDNYELLLLCWQAGHETPVHCHNKQECWVYCAEGNVEETRFTVDAEGEMQKADKFELEQYGVSYMHDEMGYHDIANHTEQKAMTLHLYVEPIDQCRIFDAEHNQFVWKEMEYDSKNGVPLNESVDS